MNVSFVILAAGKGERLGGTAKQFRRLGGKSVWRWSLDIARKMVDEKLIDEIVLVLPAENSVISEDVPADVKTVFGGATRSMSVLNALRACKGDIVLLHDAARPFLSVELCRTILSSSGGENAVIPLLPEANALKKIQDGRVSAIEREGIYITQTPQLFPRKALLEMLEGAQNFAFKDEAELWLQKDRSLDFVQGITENFKITEEGDWRMACRLAEERVVTRNGLGYDVHPLVPGRPLILGGVEIPSLLGLAGYSDADALAHAIADAILSAAGLPDIGTLYPANDEKYRDADSTLLLADAVGRVRNSGWEIEWISAALTAQRPILAPWHDKIVASLEKILGKKCVSVTFKSGEHVGPTGNCEAVYVWASATLRKSAAE